MTLSRQSIALVLTTKSNETKHYIHQKHKDKRRNFIQLTKQTKPWFGTPFTTSGQETVQALFLQPQSHHIFSAAHSNTVSLFTANPNRQ